MKKAPKCIVCGSKKTENPCGRWNYYHDNGKDPVCSVECSIVLDRRDDEEVDRDLVEIYARHGIRYPGRHANPEERQRFEEEVQKKIAAEKLAERLAG